MSQENRKFRSFPRYFIFAEKELISLVICMMLDISEYVIAILIMPLIGDVFDVGGIIACFAMFRWIGLISLLELVPGVDLLPIFIITWLAWYFLKSKK